ncbi:hypothetical protein AB0J80_10965 [Actinoplanes sp. NPDC049548]|uniref:hypothetical protein n=1 Tax=Actinoplanes sp. NPDC049548 TaxID=3155152 RepID=UPI00343E6FE1
MAALLLVGMAGCNDDEHRSAPVGSASVSGPPGSTPTGPAASEPAGSAPVTPAAGAPSSSAPGPSRSAAGASKAFPLEVARRGGFAGVDDHASISADGSAVVTRGGRPKVRTSVPPATMAELRKLLAAPNLADQATGGGICNDGYEYEIVSPSFTTRVQDCGGQHGPELDRLLTIASGLFAS